MIITSKYMINEIYIAHAKPSAVKGVIGVSSDVDAFIEKYSEDCLLKCLGYPLLKNFKENLDINQKSGLVEGADQKWDDLLNGMEYTDPNGNLVKWKGIRYKNFSTEDAPYDMSFLAQYVYFFYEKNYADARSSMGHQKAKAKNADRQTPNFKITEAWRRFYDNVQGAPFREVTCNQYGYGIDYYANHDGVTLYKFIKDANALVEDTYPDFKPTDWGRNMNQFGI